MGMDMAYNGSIDMNGEWFILKYDNQLTSYISKSWDSNIIFSLSPYGAPKLRLPRD
jgi:hypothetical protein